MYQMSSHAMRPELETSESAVRFDTMRKRPRTIGLRAAAQVLLRSASRIKLGDVMVRFPMSCALRSERCLSVTAVGGSRAFIDSSQCVRRVSKFSRRSPTDRGRAYTLDINYSCAAWRHRATWLRPALATACGRWRRARGPEKGRRTGRRRPSCTSRGGSGRKLGSLVTSLLEISLAFIPRHQQHPPRRCDADAASPARRACCGHAGRTPRIVLDDAPLRVRRRTRRSSACGRHRRSRCLCRRGVFGCRGACGDGRAQGPPKCGRPRASESQSLRHATLSAVRRVQEGRSEDSGAREQDNHREAGIWDRRRPKRGSAGEHWQGGGLVLASDHCSGCRGGGVL